MSFSSSTVRPRALLGSLAVLTSAILAAMLIAEPSASAATSPYEVTSTDWITVPSSHACVDIGGGAGAIVCEDVRVRLVSGNHVQLKPVVELYCQNGGYHQCVSTEALNYRIDYSEGIGAYANYVCGTAGGIACSSTGRNTGLGMQVDDTAVPQCIASEQPHSAETQITGVIQIKEPLNGETVQFTQTSGYEAGGLAYCVAPVFG